MQERSGYFYFRKNRFITNRIPYLRWGQAWAFHALTAYLCGAVPAGPDPAEHG